MNIIAGYISSTSGTVEVDGYDILRDPEEVKRRIGYLPEQPPVYMDMTVDEYLKFVCDIKKVKKSQQKGHLDEICELVRITEVRKRLIKNLSKGYRQRVGMSQALVGNPEVLIFDEPTVGLDPRQIIEIRKLIKQLGKQHTVVLSSHILSEVSDVCERVIIINQGQIVAQDTLENLSQGISETRRLSVRIAGSPSNAQKLIRGHRGRAVRRVPGHQGARHGGFPRGERQEPGRAPGHLQHHEQGRVPHPGDAPDGYDAGGYLPAADHRSEGVV